MNRKNSNLRAITIIQQKSTWSCEGLCVNCANRENCTFPQARSGILYCNEYE